ncbi:MAG TPA: hypothetical protein VMW08_00485 [Acidimicrobiales bacterium]|nr:hypothetical protein [Acidimicrobiales bacterium]
MPSFDEHDPVEIVTEVRFADGRRVRVTMTRPERERRFGDPRLTFAIEAVNEDRTDFVGGHPLTTNDFEGIRMNASTTGEATIERLGDDG